MYSDEKLAELILLEEMILEGLNKSFWFLIKLPTPQVWEHDQDDYPEEYSWVLGVMGCYCIYFDGEREIYIIAAFDDFGEIGESRQENEKLHCLITDIVNSRFKLP